MVVERSMCSCGGESARAVRITCVFSRVAKCNSVGVVVRVGGGCQTDVE